MKAIALVAMLACSQTYAQGAGSDESCKDDAVVCHMMKLTEALEALDKALDKAEFEELEGASVGLTALAEQLYKVSGEAFVEELEFAKVKQISDAAEEFADGLKKASKTTKTILKRDADAYEHLNALLIEIEKLELTDAGLVVRVKEAKFGDTYPAKYVIKKRWCDATAYMRAKCDRQPKCELDGDYKEKVCGFNPAPSAEPRHRGLFVDYECVRNVEDNFLGADGAGASPGSPVLKKPRSAYVVVRAHGALVCGAAK